MYAMLPHNICTLFEKCPKVYAFFDMYRFVVEQRKEVELGVNLKTYQVQNDNELCHPTIFVVILSTHGLTAFHFQLLLFSAWIQVMLINLCLHRYTLGHVLDVQAN